MIANGADKSICFAKLLISIDNLRNNRLPQALFRAFSSATAWAPPAEIGSAASHPGHLMSTFASAFAGGLLIGLSAALFLLLDGRIAGISGLVAGLARPAGEGPVGESWRTGLAFLAGLVLGPPVFALVAGSWPAMRIEASLPVLAVAGLLVGFGTRLGSGCTSGHGVCGLARLSPRSAVAVAVFLASGMLTVAAGRVLS